MGPDAARSRSEQLTVLGAGLLERLDELTEAMAARIVAEVPGYAGRPPVTMDALRAQCRDNLRTLFSTIGEPERADTSFVERSGRERAQQDVPLPLVMDSYRAAARFIWETLVAEARVRKPTLDADDVVAMATTNWLNFEMFTHTMARAYRDATTARMLTREHERSALVEALLEGRITETRTLWETAEILRIPRTGPFVVVAARVPEVGRQALGEIEDVLRGHGIASAWRLLPDLHVGLVVLPGDTQLKQLIAVLDRLASQPVGVSPVFDALERTGAALRLAEIAMAATRPKAFVTVFDDAPLAVTAAAAPEVASRVVRTVLGRLDALPAADRAVLLDTLEAWRDAGGSADAAAGTLFCHPNTVRHRLRRLAELTDRSLSAPQDVTELLLALEATRQRPQ